MYENRKNPLHRTAHEDYREICRMIRSPVKAQKRGTARNTRLALYLSVNYRFRTHKSKQRNENRQIVSHPFPGKGLFLGNDSGTTSTPRG